MNLRWIIKLTLVIVAIISALTLTVMVLARPGSNDDPLVSQSYVDANVRYRSFTLKTDQSLILPAGSELILTAPTSGALELVSGDANKLVDLTEGNRASGNSLSPNHHYLMADSNNLTLKFSG